MTDLQLPITTTAAVAIAILFLVQTISVIRIRRREGIVHGDGGNKTALKRIRGHANTSEQAPMFLILLALCEVQNYGSTLILSVLAGLFVLGRILHAYYFLDIGANFKFRQFGMIGTLMGNNILILLAVLGLLMGALS